MGEYKFSKLELLKLFANRNTHDELFYLYTLEADPIGLTRLDFVLPKNGRDIDYTFLSNSYNIHDDIKALANAKVNVKCDYLENTGTIDYFLSIVHDFYKQLDPEIYKLFLRHWHTRLHHLNVSNKKLFSSYAGEAFMCDATQDYFIALDNLGTLETSENYVHENGHLIGHHLNMQVPGKKDNTILIELESMFMELIFFDYLDSMKEIEKDSKILRGYKFLDMVDMAREMDLKYKYIDDYYAPVKFDDYVKMLSYKHGISEKYIKKQFSHLAQNIYEYVISSVYAMDLYNLYQFDKEKAIYLYKQACKVKAETDEEKMQKIKEIGLKPAQDFEPFVRKLKK